MRIVAVIPARYKSSRFEGKPLADIHGKPMIWWVYQQVKKVKQLDEIYVATDDERIEKVCNDYGIKVILTSTHHKTGTDRVCEVVGKLKADVFINVQGDEPMIEPENILKAIEPLIERTDLQVSNLMTRIKNPVDLINNTVPKVITNREGIGLYLTRSATPYPKGNLDVKYFKQVCVYGFRREALEFFANCERGVVEETEDIEILRFIENGYKVQFVEVNSETIAVDTPLDLELVKKAIKP